MAKTAKLKKKTASIRSRAARRAQSPSLNNDKSLKEITPPPQDRSSHHVLSVQNAGIGKRKKNKQQLTRGQKLRQKKVVERADIVKEQTELKVKKSAGRLKRFKDRAKGWEDVNGRRLKSKAFDVLGDVDVDGNEMGTETLGKQRTKEVDVGPKQGDDSNMEDLPIRLPVSVTLPSDEEGDDII